MNTLDWLTRLIAFDTTSRNSNLDLICAIQDWFSEHQIQARLIHHPHEKKANLFATLPAINGKKTGGIILSGHTDVVPVDGQQWDSNPFKAEILDNKVYGRGACDMKGFIAVALSLLPQFKQLQLQEPVHFAFSYDEEIGCLGAPLLIADILQTGVNPYACIVGEPSNMQPVVAHKGKQSFRCSIHGKAAHSSLTTEGCNAIEFAARLICFIRELADKFKAHGLQDNAYDIPFTTLTTNLINGGNSYNTIPELCEFIYEFRNLPGDTAKAIRAEIDNYINQQLLPMMQQEYPDAKIILDTIAAAPGLETDETADILKLARLISGEKERIKVAYATEAGMFYEAEIPTIVCGPGSIEQAHRANEYVNLEQLKLCENFLLKVMKNLNLLAADK